MKLSPAELARSALQNREAFAVIRIASVLGSTPREVGATMVVTERIDAGTIGGGRLEWEAIEAARAMLSSASKRRTISAALGPEMGQCCGGRVELMIERGAARHARALAISAAAEFERRPCVVIHGAGHVGRALAAALAALPFRVLLADCRAEELARFHAVPGVEPMHVERPVALASEAPAGAAHVVLTHSHALDAQIASAVLERDAFGYLGIIGSQTKKALFIRAFLEIGLPDRLIGRVVCPIGGGVVKDKRPEVIAALAAAEIVTALLGAKT